MMRQAIVTDIYEEFRTGGIDWARMADLFDAVGIRAVIGLEMDDLFPEHVNKALAHNIKYFTYGVPQKRFPPDEQADFYLETDGVDGHPMAGDIEISNGELILEYQARRWFEWITGKRNGDSPWYYSNYYYTKLLGFPAWVRPLKKWWAEYPYEWITKYRRFENYLSKNAWKIPKWAASLQYTPILHQFTDYGEGPYYYTNLKTDDPRWRDGKKSVDLNVSLIDADQFLALFSASVSPPLSIEERVSKNEDEIKILKGFHGLQ